jgi:hypothetical protein
MDIFWPLFLSMLFVMSYQEIFNHLKHAKIQHPVLLKICFCFAKDFTAIQTAKEVNLSRQTVNNYYKILRNLLLKKQDDLIHIKKNTYVKGDTFFIKCIKHACHTHYFIESDNKALFIDEYNDILPNLKTFIKEHIHVPLQNNKRVNTAKILFNKTQNRYILLNLSHKHENVQHFIQDRLKKFRGVNKHNLSLHIKESQYRYNYPQEQLHKTLVSMLGNTIN